jgi:hypothetical protein
MANPKPKAGPGRPTGSKNLISMAKVKEVLLQANKNPVTEILRLVGGLSERDQVTTWLALLRFIEAPAPVEVVVQEDNAILITYSKQEQSGD